MSATRPRVYQLAAMICCLLALSLACIERAAGPDGTPRIPQRHAPAVHFWVFHIAGGPFDAHVQLAMIRDRPTARGEREFRALPSTSWDGSAVNDFAGYEAVAGDSTGRLWLFRSSGVDVMRLAYDVVGDTATGSLTFNSGEMYPVMGVRFQRSAASLTIAPALPSSALMGDSTPTVLVRLDDAMGTDRAFLQRLADRGLVAEIAAPTRLVGGPGRLTWDELQFWRARQMGVVAHSRYHQPTGAGGASFVAEVVGGMTDMDAIGMRTTIFVQPGSWTDSIYFDTPGKLQTWRGSLLRTFSTVAECYAFANVRRAGVYAQGLSHVTISDGLTDDRIRGAWLTAQRPFAVTVFLVHTWRLKTPDQVDWFLDLIADAKSRGVIRVVSTSDQLFGWETAGVVAGDGGDSVPPPNQAARARP